MLNPPNSPSPELAPLSSRAVLLRLLPLVWIVFFSALAIAVPLPVLALRVHDQLGFSIATAGLAVGIQSIATLLTRQTAGSAVDRYGAKTAVVIGLPLAVTAGLLYLGSLQVPGAGASLAVLVLGRLCLGLAESLFLTGAMSWGIGRVGLANTGRVMAWQGIALYAAIGIGAPIGIALNEAYGFVGVAAVAAGAPLLAVPMALLVASVPTVPGRRLGFHKVLGLIWRHGVALALATAPFAVLATFLALVFASRGWPHAGAGLFLFGATYIAVRLFLAHLPDRIGGKGVAAVSLLILAAAQLMLWVAPGPGLALAGAALSGVGFSLIFPALGVEAVRRVPAESRGLAVGGFLAFFDIALGVTAPVAGVLVAAFGYGSMFLAGAIGCLLSFCLVLTLPRTRA
ncbi:MFS transporter [Xanthobacter sp. DSM 24535]|uniref:MFS transporter n=1 Tax=Roseixanthobacter psychrophilus TaxID=3119917 RepID=UPI0037268876